MFKSIIKLAIIMLAFTPLALSGQAVVGGATPDPSAILDVQSSNRGFLFPRMSTAERNAIASPARGLVIFNTATKCLEINQGTPAAPQWERAYCRSGSISGLDCGNPVVSGATVSLPYTGGNGGVYDGNSASSTGVTGLTASLSGGNFADGAGMLDWNITGLPSSTGTADFVLSANGFTCNVSFSVNPGSIFSLNCAGTTYTGVLTVGMPVTGAAASVPYTGGNGGIHSGQTVSSTGVAGLTATLNAGFFASGAGTLTYSISGTPAQNGTASFALNIGGQTCTLDIPVSSCRAKINATDYKNFLCYNLGAANTSADPFTPGWEINGGYWQWGRAAQAAAGPTGPGAAEANSGPVSGWNTTYAQEGAWADNLKTANDPCPSGFRVPTIAQWVGVQNNNTSEMVGTWGNDVYDHSNYGAGRKFGDYLMLPAAGERSSGTGSLSSRGGYGAYWSSTWESGVYAWLFAINESGSYDDYYPHIEAYPVRCIAEDITSLDCGSATVTGTLSPGYAASGVSASVPYTGGDGSAHSGQTVTSTGVTGLTATLAPGNFATGSGNLMYSITGTPSMGGTASFALNVGGKSCTLNVPVVACRAKVNATDYKNFLCYNLGSANTSADPFTPSWEINGGYWQWGRAAEAAAGPTGPGAGDANSSAVSGWNTTRAPNGSWADGSKTANDPCPTGYRIPTHTQWDGVVTHNTLSRVGTFSNSPTNYGVGIKFGDQLMLQAAGYRNRDEGALLSRGFEGVYWSSSEYDNVNAWSLYFGSSFAYMYGGDDRLWGYSIRCIEDIPGAVGTLNCGGATVTGAITSGQAATGVSASVPYTGGNGGFHSGQTVTSTGVTGLTATLSAGNFASGTGSLLYTITGTATSGGTASFALNIGGQTCTLDVTVAFVCRAKVTATDYKNFLCYNLGAANTSADPFTPSWEINGGYWQWGRAAEAAAGPTGPGAGDANDSAVSGWNTTGAPDGSWSDVSKTADDPCPAGYRIPTIAQWEGVFLHNAQTNLGSWSNSAVNYTTGRLFGAELMLPGAGTRNRITGALSSRGSFSSYWSSTVFGANVMYMYFGNGYDGTDDDSRTYGNSVRCIAE